MLKLRGNGAKTDRKSLQLSASVLGLAAGALSVSGMAYAANEETQIQTLFPADHYSLKDDGVVILKLESGEHFSLNPEQYLILQDGVLLITDEIAQTSVESLPLMGAIRSQLASDVQPVFSPDGTIVETSNAQPLWTGEGLAPRLFEQVEIQRFELAQNSAEDPAETESPNAVVGGGVLVGGVLAAITLALPPEATAEEVPAADPQPDPLPQPVLPFLSDAAFQALSPPRAWTGSTADNYIGYSAASLANPDPIQSAAYASFDMSAGGSNYLLAGLGAGSAGSFSYTGGSGDDTLSFNEDLGYVGSASFDMQLGGNNTLDAAGFAAIGGSLTYNGGPGKDTVSFGDELAAYNGNASFVMGNGENSLSLDEAAANENGTITYTGGTGTDELTFANGFSRDSSNVVLDLGSDTAADHIEFLGSAGDNGGNVTIQNYDVS